MCITIPGKVDSHLERMQNIFLMAGGVDRAADLVKHYWEVGYGHLVPSYVKYNWSWIQYYNVDVKATLGFTLLLTLILALRVFDYCCCRVIKQKQA